MRTHEPNILKQYVTLVVILLMSCGPASLETEYLSVRDSAGVQIVEIRTTVWEEGDAWTIATSPDVVIGSAHQQPPELPRVGAARSLANGNIVIFEGNARQLRVYDSTGTFLHTIGRPGGLDALGEVGWIQVLPGDTILTVDNLYQRINAYSQTGTTFWTRNFGDDGFGRWESLGDVRLSDGSLVTLWHIGIQNEVQRGNVSAGEIRRGVVFGVRYGDESVDTLGVFPGNEYSAVRQGNRLNTVTPLLAKSFVHATLGDHLYVGTQETFTIRRLTTDGALDQVIRWPGTDLTITDEFVQAWVSTRLTLVDSDRQEQVRQILTSYPASSTIPAFGRMLFDTEGLLWISEAYNPAGGTPTRWYVFDETVGMLGAVEFPERMQVEEIGRDHILGHRVIDGVSYIERYALRRDR